MKIVSQPVFFRKSAQFIEEVQRLKTRSSGNTSVNNKNEQILPEASSNGFWPVEFIRLYFEFGQLKI